MLWGELVPVPDPDLAALWYRRAIAYLPSYVKARVHLAEIYLSADQTADAEALLVPALSSRDPEVRWRLADVLIAQDKFEEAKMHLDAALDPAPPGRRLLSWANSWPGCQAANQLAASNISPTALLSRCILATSRAVTSGLAI